MKLRNRIGAAAVLAGTVAAASLAIAAPAQADGAADFFACLNRHGYTITDVAVASDVGWRVQQDEIANVSRVQIISNLQRNWGMSYYQANVYVDCAYQTMGGT